MTLAFLENQQAAALTLQSAQEYRYWLLIYARFLVNEGNKLSNDFTFSSDRWEKKMMLVACCLDLSACVCFLQAQSIASENCVKSCWVPSTNQQLQPGSPPLWYDDQLSACWISFIFTSTFSKCFHNFCLPNLKVNDLFMLLSKAASSPMTIISLWSTVITATKVNGYPWLNLMSLCSCSYLTTDIYLFMSLIRGTASSFLGPDLHPFN